MGFKAKAQSSEGEFELPIGGSYPAVFIGLIDLGTQDREYKGEKWQEHKIVFAWELTSEQNSDGENFVVIRDFTLSLHEKANLRKMLDAYNGKPIADGSELDLIVLMGKPCVLSISEGKSGSGQKFVEVTTVARPIKGQTVPPATRPSFVFDLDLVEDPTIDPQIPDWVPFLYGRKIADDVKKSPEWKRLAAVGVPASSTATNGKGTKPMTQAEIDAPEDKPPF